MSLLYSKGFSFVEILVSLFLVSFVSVNVIGLQQVVLKQSKHNAAYSRARFISSSKMELLTLLAGENQLFYGDPETKKSEGTIFFLNWELMPLTSQVQNNLNLKKVSLTTSWESDGPNKLKITEEKYVTIAPLNRVRL